MRQNRSESARERTVALYKSDRHHHRTLWIWDRRFFNSSGPVECLGGGVFGVPAEKSMVFCFLFFV